MPTPITIRLSFMPWLLPLLPTKQLKQQQLLIPSNQVMQWKPSMQPPLEWMKPLLCLIMVSSQESKHFLMAALPWTPSLIWQQCPLLICTWDWNWGRISCPECWHLWHHQLQHCSKHYWYSYHHEESLPWIWPDFCGCSHGRMWRLTACEQEGKQGNSEQWTDGSLHHWVPNWWGQALPDCSLSWIHLQQGYLCATPLQGSHASCHCR